MTAFLVILRAHFSEEHSVIVPSFVKALDKQVAYNIAHSYINDEMPGLNIEFISIHDLENVQSLEEAVVEAPQSA